MSDLISRQALCEYALNQKDKSVTPNDIMRFPSAQPDLCDGCDRYGASCVGEGCGKLEMFEVAKDTNVLINDCISRQAAIDALDNIKIPRNASWYPYYQQALTAMSRLPSAYPETDGFCTDCKEYDQERHFCPRFDRVIKTTIEEMKAEQQWIPVSERLPEDVEIGEEYPTVLFCTKDVVYVGFYEHSNDGNWWSYDGDYVIDGVLAWMPLPEPYTERREDG